MDFTALQTLLASLVALQQQAVDAQALVEQAYQKGFVDGVVSVPPIVSEKIYTQEELDAKIQEALLPLNEKVAALEAEIALVPEKIVAGVALIKAELLAKYEELQVAESAGEVGFLELLK